MTTPRSASPNPASPNPASPNPASPNPVHLHPYGASALDVEVPVDSHWRAITPALAVETPALVGDAAVDAVVIGGGYTGLWAARRLAATHGMEVRVLEAGDPGWGASGRNGGFVCIGASALSAGDLEHRYGLAETQRFYALQLDAIERVRALLVDSGRDAGLSPDGEVSLAHKPSRMKDLRAEAEHLHARFGYEMTVLSKGEIVERGLDGPGFFGGLHNAHGFAVNPLSYARALAERAVADGVVIHGRSAVTGWRCEGDHHVVETETGRLRARRLVLATNGYSREDVPPWIAGRPLPLMSNILVTRPMAEDEWRAQGFFSRVMAFDTRTLLHYFRRLPDDRFLFGARGSLDNSPEGLAAARARLRREFEMVFPAWAGVETERFWSGLVCLTRDRVPFVGAVPGHPGAVAAMGYHGNGVAFSNVAGRLAADLIAGKDGAEAAVPAMLKGPLRRFPLPGFRTSYLRAAFAGYAFADRFL